MVNKKICLISINSYNELTGGGLYLRTIVSFLKKNNADLTLIDKYSSEYIFSDKGFKHLSFTKGYFQDVFSRLLLLPSFYMPYLFSVMKIFKGNEIVGFHNSRLGLLCFLCRIFYPSKKIILFTDNFEYDLVRQKKISPSIRWEKIIVKFNEWLGLKKANLVSYITNHDKISMECYYGSIKPKSLILPVIFTPGACKKIFSKNFSERLLQIQGDERRKLIFTASFDFFPNIDAAHKIISQAKSEKDILFILAGRKLSTLPLPVLDNLILFNDLSNSEMSSLLCACEVFYSPLVIGSGMKTKVAEALSHGLHIYATEHTMIGYEDIVNDKNCVTVIKNVNEPIAYSIKNNIFNKEVISSMQDKHYSLKRFTGKELDVLLKM
ncbi:glycosyl transferase family 1 [Salmonella enterica]|uniref:Glycosyltransferase family 4 protein n=1 Tax=Salmonella enterica TaxID=28901 RepID=A0A5Y7WBJ1_SALER|nr:glycosyl transferase family 1 [Salmonella enterica]EDW8125966.1 glycosyltransferase family 4 protein [Salmonella enterica subsp. salamae]EJU7776874.1 glycosyl transferase family 1 [Salmonella enterica subsp. arizonae serovar 6,7:g,z51:-]EAX3733240.1 glycosyltransferase family 4 protein [Salmonella enterica]ECQ3014316.1 glycosyltransferase family 4 protein [Salmonella enterica]